MVATRSFRDFRMSSSRELVASFKLTKSVALSLLRLLNCVISFCRLDTIVVMLSSWVEMASRFSGPAGGVLDGVFVMLFKGGSIMCGGMFIVCSAIMVADGGVFSPNIALCGGLADGRNEGVSLRPSRLEGVGVPKREGLRSPPK